MSACTVIVIGGNIGGVQTCLRSLAHIREGEGIGIGNLREVGRIFVVEAVMPWLSGFEGFAEERSVDTSFRSVPLRRVFQYLDSSPDWR